MGRSAKNRAAGDQGALFRAIVEGAHDTIIAIDADGIIVAANPAAKRYLGYAPEELIGRSYLLVVPERFHQQLAPLCSGGGLADPADIFGGHGVVEGYVRHKDGTEILTEFSCQKISLEGRSAYVFVDRDIRERRASERALQNAHDELEARVAERTAELQESEARFRAVFESAPSAIYLKDTEGHYLLVNRHFEERVGLKAKDILGKRAEDLSRYAAELVETYLAQEREVLESGQTIVREQPWVQLSGPSGVNLVTKFPVYDAEQNIFALGTISHDITALKQAAELARANERRLRMVADSLPAIVVHIDAELRFTFVNRFYCEWHGMTPDEVLGRHIKDVIGEQSFAIIRPKMDDALAGQPVSFEADLVYKKVGRKFVRIDYVPDVREDGRIAGFYSLALDISDQKAAEAALRASEAKLSRILAIAPDAIISIDPNQTIRMFNQGAEAVFGFSAEEALGQPLGILLPTRSHEAHAHHITGFISAHEDSRLMTQRGEIMGRRKDGSEFPAEASISKLHLGSETVLTVMLHDITERKNVEAELLTAKETAEFADRAKSDFLANMSHELRTPLNAIIGFAELMRQQTFGPIGDSRYHQYSTDILESGDHLLSLINDILDLSKIEAGQMELNEAKVDLAEIGHECLRGIEIQLEEAGLSIDLGGTAGLPLLWADGRMLRQMLLNLLSNAVKFTKRGGRITLSGKLAADGTLALSVSDTGIGISAADLPSALANFGQIENVLDRYHEGTGLGLPLVASMAELHGGSLQVESEPGVGTTVTIWFPKERLLKE